MWSVLIAIGTFLLAGGTFWLAWTTARLHRDSERERLDSQGPQLMIQQFEADMTPVQIAGDQWAVVEPSRWDQRQHGELVVGIPARVTLINEGPRSALLELSAPPDTEIVGISYVPEPRAMGFTASVVKQGDWYVLSPGMRATLSIVRRREVREWIDAWNRAGRRSGPPTELVMLTAISPTAPAVRDTAVLSLNAYAFVQHPEEDVWIPAPGPIRGVLPRPLAVIGPWHRSYPAHVNVWLRRAWNPVQRAVRALSTRKPPLRGSGMML